MNAVSLVGGGGRVGDTEQREQVSPAGVDLGEAIEAFLRETGFVLDEWQRQMVTQMYRVQVIQPRRHSLSAAVEAHARRLGFQPIVNAREAAVLTRHGLREGEHFQRYPEAPVVCEPPDDPMLAAIEAKKRRNTGPPPDRLDGRRRRRR